MSSVQIRKSPLYKHKQSSIHGENAHEHVILDDMHLDTGDVTERIEHLQSNGSMCISTCIQNNPVHVKSSAEYQSIISPSTFD